MITIYTKTPQGLRKCDVTALTAAPENAVWVDLNSPTPEEEHQVEAVFGLDIPTREELHEIEVSSRLFVDGQAQFMTATLLCKADTQRPQTTSVTFIISGNRLVTVRYDDPRPFATFPVQAERHQEITNSALDIMIGLLDAIVDRTADVLERVEREIDALSMDIFAQRTDGFSSKSAGAVYQEALQKIGRSQMIALKVGESLVSVGRVVAFLSRPSGESKLPKPSQQRLKTLARDIGSLTDHTSHLADTITFLLDAVLGLIQSEQNAVIKIFTIAAVVFLPPTLVATVYGMNFKIMPELDWHFGYPLSLILMFLSAVLPLWYFRRRGWL